MEERVGPKERGDVRKSSRKSQKSDSSSKYSMYKGLVCESWQDQRDMDCSPIIT